jgi:hypothetical protein
VDRCGDCGHEEISYNSCRDRHCPKCQTRAKNEWVESQLQDLLPIRYFHVVFTVPQKLFALGLCNQKEFYDLLFESSSQTLRQFEKDEKYLGGRLGFFGILHSWGQKLWFHPHVHYIVSGGGLSHDGSQWIPSKKSSGKFLFSVKALSVVFQGKFISGLRKLYESDSLRLEGELEELKNPDIFESYLSSLVQHRWVVYAKSPFKSAERVVKYIGRYSHRVAISNSRLLEMKEGRICFSYKDYQDQNRQKVLNLGVDDFIQRFLWHVLPEGFHRIRHYGFLANGQRQKNLERIRQILKVQDHELKMKIEILSEQQTKEIRPLICPHCEKGELQLSYFIPAFLFHSNLPYEDTS